MRDLTIFAKPHHYYRRGTVTTRTPHMFRTSSLIRGEQMAQYLGCKYNPTEGWEDDVCVWVKPREEIDKVRDGDYVDVLDNFALIDIFKSRPNVNLIFCSQYHYETFKDVIPNKSVFIPHHHCNFERAVRTKKEVDTVGYIGSMRGIDIEIPDITHKLKEIGMKFVYNFRFKNREESVNFYKNIDIQFIWKRRFAQHTPMKLVNAASYGIPSVSRGCKNYKEVEGFYIGTGLGIENAIREIKRLKDEPEYYKQWSDKLVPAMEKYHIENIAKLYRQLQ